MWFVEQADGFQCKEDHVLELPRGKRELLPNVSTGFHCGTKLKQPSMRPRAPTPPAHFLITLRSKTSKRQKFVSGTADQDIP